MVIIKKVTMRMKRRRRMMAIMKVRTTNGRMGDNDD